MRTTLAMVLLAAGLAACGDDDTTTADAPGGGPDAPGGGPDGPGGGPDAPAGTSDAPPGAFMASGTVVGAGAADGPVVVSWGVSTGMDYAYKFGEGASDGATFSVSLAGDPPAAARNIAGTTDFGVGIMVLVPPGTVIPDGVVTGDPPVVGVSARHALIYRGPGDDASLVPWTADFPVGLSCGVCVDNPSGFDGYAPVDCAELVITTDPGSDFCNWT